MALRLVLYTAALERLSPETWLDRADEVLLIEHGTGWVFDIDDVSLTPMNLGATELAADFYDRQPLVPGSPVWDGTEWSLPVAGVVWGGLGVDEDVAAAVGYEPGVDDGASVPLWALFDDEGDPIETCDGTDMVLAVTLSVGQAP